MFDEDGNRIVADPNWPPEVAEEAEAPTIDLASDIFPAESPSHGRFLNND